MFLALGALGMFIVGLLMRRTNHFKISKLVVLTLLLTVSGVFGTLLLYFIESGGSWGGYSYYGAVFFIPIFMAVCALIMRTSVNKILDFSAYAQCAMLAIMKINCFVSGCCSGVLLHTFSTGSQFYFPSQILESLNSVVVMLILIQLAKKHKYDGLIYPIYFIIYGAARFVFNCFRDGVNPVIWILPYGHIWSLLSITIGVIWIGLIMLYRKKSPKFQEKELERDNLLSEQETLNKARKQKQKQAKQKSK